MHSHISSSQKILENLEKEKFSINLWANTTNEKVYLDALRDILENGELRKTRNSTTLSKFSIKLDFDIRNSFPLLTTKKVYWKGVLHELLWFIKGDTNSKNLEYNNVNIWKGNSSREFLDSSRLYNYEEGDCGPIYGFQWRHFGTPYKGYDCNYNWLGVDQLQNCINLIKNDPNSRRIFMSAWNPVQLNDMCLPPCHVSYQFYVNNKNELSCSMYQRSGDMFLGIPFNIASVSLLVYIIAMITGTKPGTVSIIIGDAHIYESHIDQVKEQLKREPYESPLLFINKKFSNINDYKYEHFEIFNYKCHPTIKAPMIP
jgi:thymidylate synthase